MTDPDDTALWRNRFITINLARIGGTLVALFGLFVWQTDWLRPGGAIEIGLPVAIIGVLLSFLLPPYLVGRWRTPKP